MRKRILFGILLLMSIFLFGCFDTSKAQAKDICSLQNASFDASASKAKPTPTPVSKLTKKQKKIKALMKKIYASKTYGLVFNYSAYDSLINTYDTPIEFCDYLLDLDYMQYFRKLEDDEIPAQSDEWNELYAETTEYWQVAKLILPKGMKSEDLDSDIWEDFIAYIGCVAEYSCPDILELKTDLEYLGQKRELTSKKLKMQAKGKKVENYGCLAITVDFDDVIEKGEDTTIYISYSIYKDIYKGFDRIKQETVKDLQLRVQVYFR